MKRIIAAVAAAGAVALALTPIASAAGDTFTLEKEVFAPGEKMVASIVKDSTCTGWLTSPGLRTQIGFPVEDNGRMYGHSFVIDTPGKYEATMTCDGKPVVKSFEIKLVPVSDFYLGKDEFVPGAEIFPAKPKNSDCTGPVTSKGFTAPIDLTQDIGPAWAGTGTVVTAPGIYEASMTCAGGTVTRKFTIKGAAPEAPKQAPKPKVVKPKGAPQTGGGATA